jgi:hypothetical protein
MSFGCLFLNLLYCEGSMFFRFKKLFDKRRDLFADLSAVFMDTTSLSFYGEGGETLGEHGYSKDYRPDLRQMILALIVDGAGRPICTEMWPGNTADVTTLLPVVDRLRRRFSIGARIYSRRAGALRCDCSSSWIRRASPSTARAARRSASEKDRKPPKNASVAPSVVPRRLEFRRNSHEIKDLWKSGVQVG